MEEKSVLQVGGTIEKALKGDYKIDVKAVLNEAWEKTKQSRIAINIGLAFIMTIGVVVSIIFSQYFGGVEAIIKDQQTSALLNIIITLLLYPFLVGVEMMGVFHSVGLKTHAKLIFAFLSRGSWVAICAIMSSVLVTLGLGMLYIPGIYLMVALSLVLPLVVEKKLSPLNAIVLSLKATRFQWFHLFTIYMILFLLLFASLLPLIILSQTSAGLLGGVITLFSLTYLAPLFYNVKGILYREIFGMQLNVVNDKNSTVEGNFSA